MGGEGIFCFFWLGRVLHPLNPTASPLPIKNIRENCGSLRDLIVQFTNIIKYLGVQVCNKDENYKVMDCIKKSSVSIIINYLFIEKDSWGLLGAITRPTVKLPYP